MLNVSIYLPLIGTRHNAYLNGSLDNNLTSCGRSTQFGICALQETNERCMFSCSCSHGDFRQSPPA